MSRTRKNVAKDIRNDSGIFGKFVSIIRPDRVPFFRRDATGMFDVSPLFRSSDRWLYRARTSPTTGVVINLVVALTADGGHDIRNVGGSGVFVLSANNRFHPWPKSVARETSFTRRFLICEPDETVDSS